ncbi:MAG: CRTAC1 family protein [Pirellulales bacterium]|nr:CRTAC1 family protein [Pirellulales bacterium]
MLSEVARYRWAATCRSVAWWVVWVCLADVAAARNPIQLRDVTHDTGIRFRHTDGGSGTHYIVETVSAGLALFDYDGDEDVCFLNGAPLRGAEIHPPPRNALYRNDGGWRFTDVTDRSGTGDLGYGLGVAVADYDNDGDPDLYLNNYGPNVLYRNNGDGTFTDVAQRAGVTAGDRVGAGTCFLDMDRDGDLDLYAATYLRFSYDAHVTKTTRGVPVYANPRFYPPAPDLLFRNNADGTFTDVSAASGIAAHSGWGMGMVCADYDNDGDRDIFVACGHLQDNVEQFDDTTSYLARNILLMNTGDGEFVNVSDQCGDGLAVKLSSRGAAFDDLDNDGDVTQIDEVHSGRGYQSHYGARLYFGLGRRDRVDRIEVRWIGGGVDVIRNVGVDRLVTITEGGTMAATPR